MIEATHACPPNGSGRMPCCDRTPFEVPGTDRMTLQPEMVTCRGIKSSVEPDFIPDSTTGDTHG